MNCSDRNVQSVLLRLFQNSSGRQQALGQDYAGLVQIKERDSVQVLESACCSGFVACGRLLDDQLRDVQVEILALLRPPFGRCLLVSGNAQVPTGSSYQVADVRRFQIDFSSRRHRRTVARLPRVRGPRQSSRSSSCRKRTIIGRNPRASKVACAVELNNQEVSSTP